MIVFCNHDVTTSKQTTANDRKSIIISTLSCVNSFIQLMHMYLDSKGVEFSFKRHGFFYDCRLDDLFEMKSIHLNISKNAVSRNC